MGSDYKVIFVDIFLACSEFNITIEFCVLRYLFFYPRKLLSFKSILRHYPKTYSIDHIISDTFTVDRSGLGFDGSRFMTYLVSVSTMSNRKIERITRSKNIQRLHNWKLEENGHYCWKLIFLLNFISPTELIKTANCLVTNLKELLNLRETIFVILSSLFLLKFLRSDPFHFRIRLFFNKTKSFK